MHSSDWSNGIRYHTFDTRSDTEFKLLVSIQCSLHQTSSGEVPGGGGWGQARGRRADIRRTTLLGFSVERRLRPTLRFLVEHFPDTNAADIMWLATCSAAGETRAAGAAAAEARPSGGQYAVSSMAALTPVEFREKVCITIEEYDDEVETCDREHAERHLSPGRGRRRGGGRGRGRGGGRGGQHRWR
jgi:hypothetical protein